MGYLRRSKAKQDRLVEHFVAGTTARCAAALTGVNAKTAVYYFHRRREIVAYHLEQELDTVGSGEIEVENEEPRSRATRYLEPTPTIGVLAPWCNCL